MQLQTQMRPRRDMRSFFYKKYKKEAQEYKPKKVVLPPGQTLFARVNVAKAIRESAKTKRRILILYRKIQVPRDSIEYYEISPMSYRYRKVTIDGRKVTRKMLYVWDEEKLPHQMRLKTRRPWRYRGLRRNRGTIKMFVVNRVHNCCMTSKPYSKWVKRRIEIY